MDLAGFLKDYGAPGAWIFAAIGWFISNRHANTREKRKEFRGEIEAIEKIIKLVSEKLSTYFKLQNRNDVAIALELEIKLLFKELDMKWDRLSKRDVPSSMGNYQLQCKTALERLFDFSTSQFFETSNRLPLNLIDEHIVGINIRALQFVEALHSLFLKKFDDI
jgi:hypothetical protein